MLPWRESSDNRGCSEFFHWWMVRLWWQRPNSRIQRIGCGNLNGSSCLDAVEILTVVPSQRLTIIRHGCMDIKYRVYDEDGTDANSRELIGMFCNLV